jgi:hypothetical protein
MSVFSKVETNVLLLTETSRPQVKQQGRQFIICDDCFWVASAVSRRYFDPVNCPVCGKPLSSIPISNGESYAYKYTKTRGIELDFFSERYRPR